MSKSSDPSWRTRIYAAVYILTIFSVGIVAGAGLYRLVRPRQRCPAKPRPPMFRPLPLEELGLSEKQWRQVRSIMERHRPALDKVLKQIFPRVRAINAKMKKEIRAILTAEQRKRLDDMEAHRPPGRPGGPPPPPGGMFPGHPPGMFPGPPGGGFGPQPGGPVGPPPGGGPPGGPFGPPPGGGPPGGPFGPPPGGGLPGGGPPGGSGGALGAKTFPVGPADKRILAVIHKLQSRRRGMANVPLEDGRLLRLLVEAIGARNVVEVGLSNGYSSLWMALGLLRTGGRLTSFEIDPRKVKLARANFGAAGIEKLVTVVVGDAHKKVGQVKGPIDLLFLDADKPGYPDYLKQLLPKVRPGGLVVAHNMVRPPPDPRFVKAIATDPTLETLFLHLQGAGIAVSLKKRSVVK